MGLLPDEPDDVTVWVGDPDNPVPPKTLRTNAITTLLIQLHKDELKEGDPVFDLAVDLSEIDDRQAKCKHLEPYTKKCDQHGTDPWSCPDILFSYMPEHGYGIPVRDGGHSQITITHCPFCGIKLNETP